MNQKRSAMDRTAADKNYVAEATRRRRRILRAGFFFISFQVFRNLFVRIFQIASERLREW